MLGLRSVKQHRYALRCKNGVIYLTYGILLLVTGGWHVQIALAEENNRILRGIRIQQIGGRVFLSKTPVSQAKLLKQEAVFRPNTWIRLDRNSRATLASRNYRMDLSSGTAIKRKKDGGVFLKYGNVRLGAEKRLVLEVPNAWIMVEAGHALVQVAGSLSEIGSQINATLYRPPQFSEIFKLTPAYKAFLQVSVVSGEVKVTPKAQADRKPAFSHSLTVKAGDRLRIYGSSQDFAPFQAGVSEIKAASRVFDF